MEIVALAVNPHDPTYKRTHPHGMLTGQKESDLHKFKAYPDPNGNRAERRAAKKKKRKK